MKRRTLLALAAIAVLLISSQPASATHQKLKRNRISMFSGSQTYPASEPSFVNHGWIWPFEECLLEDNTIDPGLNNMTFDELAERLDPSSDVWHFELTVDGVPVPLGSTFHRQRDPVECDGGIAKWNFVQFDKDEFEPGTYSFTGTWYGDVDDDDISEVELSITIDVTFT